MPEKINVTIRIPEETWKNFKIYCIEQNLKVGEKVSNLLESEMKKEVILQ